MRGSEELNVFFSYAIWIARSLFSRNKTSGSSANISFRFNNHIYISGTGTCFGALEKESFSKIDMDGKSYSDMKPSKEFPLHLILYNKNPFVNAVIHTHSFYSVLWSCYCNEENSSPIPRYTPYLEMKLGAVGLIPYALPGSTELIDLFIKNSDNRRGYLLKNHGPIVCGADLLSAFYALEELEESARIAWELRGMQIPEIPS
jgi:ribulose-5-phosphate 4-epimerase/fuculose-1-phosphate aldolase